MVRFLLWECRSAQNISLRELEKRSGISRSTLQRMESGKSSPTLMQMDIIAEALHINIAQLYEYCNDSK